MSYRNIIILVTGCALLCCFVVQGIPQEKLDEKMYHAYGVNAWIWDLPRVNLMKRAHIYYCRIMVPWFCLEAKDDTFTWNGGTGDRAADFEFHLVNLRAANHCARKNVKLSLCVYGSPKWARKDPGKALSFDPEEYCEFITELLKYCDSIAPGIVEAVEVTNEEPTGEWVGDKPPVYGTDQRDPSQHYADILKAAYKTIKSYNPKILVVTDGIWAGAYHHLDELYQLGCKGYFDRINFHYYTGEDIGVDYRIRVGPDTIGVEHFPTVLGYLKSIADRNADTSPIWLTEFGWRLDEKKKARYLEFVLDTCRKSGFVERINYYEFASHDILSLVYPKTLKESDDPVENEEFGWVGVSYTLTKSYDTFKEFAKKNPVWDKKEKIDFISGASGDAKIINSGFESGKDGWKGEFVTDSNTKHKGSYSAKIESTATLVTDTFDIRSTKLYEVSFWVKVNSESPDNIICVPSINYLMPPDQLLKTESPNCWGIVDTRKYPEGWRRVIFPAVAPKGSRLCKLVFDVKGEGEVYIDDVKMAGLDLNYLNSPE